METLSYNIETVSHLDMLSSFVLILSWTLDAVFNHSYFGCICCVLHCTQSRAGMILAWVMGYGEPNTYTVTPYHVRHVTNEYIYFFEKISFASQKLNFSNFYFLTKKSVKMTLNSLEVTKCYKN